MNQRRSKTVLVVDDDADLVLAFRKRLISAGYNVITATSGTQAFREARAGHIDAITLDVGLWDQISGLDVASILSREPETGAIPILFITGQADDAFASRQREAGGRCFLSKPVDMDLLIRVLDGLFGFDELSEARRISSAKRRQPIT